MKSRVANPHPHASLIVALGGTTKLSRALKARRAAVQNWMRRGIPHRYRYRCAGLAIAAGLPLPGGFLDGETE